MSRNDKRTLSESSTGSEPDFGGGVGSNDAAAKSFKVPKFSNSPSVPPPGSRPGYGGGSVGGRNSGGGGSINRRESQTTESSTASSSDEDESASSGAGNEPGHGRGGSGGPPHHRPSTEDDSSSNDERGHAPSGPSMGMPSVGMQSSSMGMPSMGMPSMGMPSMGMASSSMGRPSVSNGSGVVSGSTSSTGGYSSFAQKMMSKMGHVEGKGLGKKGQGIVEPVKASDQRGRRGFGMIIRSLEDPSLTQWQPEKEHVEIEETQKWLPTCDLPCPDIKELRTWMSEGKRKETIADETTFCSSEVLSAILKCKSVFDGLEPEELRKARTRSNPFETIRGGFFLNRAAMKMANMDAVFDFMFSNPKTAEGRPLVGRNSLLYFADVCAGPGGFSEYILWKKKWRCKGFGFTLKGTGHDFKIEDFFAGPPESFETHYGVGGKDGDGDVFREDNLREFKKFVLESTDGQGVHFMMADGGFSVEGNENIQEILSKQLYLCQFLFAAHLVRTGGHFVCKIFDLFTPFSVGLVYLMYRMFDKVAIHKPNTSRPANSERYIICKNKRHDCQPIADYLVEINCRINQLGFSQLGTTRSQVDVNDIVPLEILRDDTEFWNYMVQSNETLGEWQVMGLAKIVHFARNSALTETRQAQIKEECLKYWKVPDQVRKAPQGDRPEFKVVKMVGSLEFMSDTGTQLVSRNYRDQLKTGVYDWKFVLLGSSINEAGAVSMGGHGDRGFFYGMGRSKVYRLTPRGSWERTEDTLRFEMPAGTLVYGEVVREMRGEARSMRRVTAFHIIDALYLGGEDLREMDIKTRNELAVNFCKAMNKPTVPDYVTIRAKELFGLEHLPEVLNHLKPRMLKGAGGKFRLTQDVGAGHDVASSAAHAKYFTPTGVLMQRVVKEPYLIAFSKSQKKKYWFNTRDRQSAFECPKCALVDFKTSFLKRLEWNWEEGVQLVPDQEIRPNPEKLQAKDFLDFVRSQVQR